MAVKSSMEKKKGERKAVPFEEGGLSSLPHTRKDGGYMVTVYIRALLHNTKAPLSYTAGSCFGPLPQAYSLFLSYAKCILRRERQVFNTQQLFNTYHIYNEKNGQNML